ncbi:hypothetical protein LWI28_006726 [Acer negundo]|uniref:Uncharacterized protein n=1 Tax=Acer negundo TaxID=4023 RepID=A0AAD5IU92_ACENE|nr:hypothetical protein LWI28_006726 [Acer negundo]
MSKVRSSFSDANLARSISPEKDLTYSDFNSSRSLRFCVISLLTFSLKQLSPASPLSGPTSLKCQSRQ